MRVLALDTSTRITAAALLDGDQTLGLYQEPARSHSKSLLPALDALIRAAGLQTADLEGVAVGLGPGSFTGVRIGMTVAKTLAHAAGLPLVGVSSLRALAENGRPLGSWICPASDALKNEVYCAQFELVPAGQDRTIQSEAARAPASWAAALAGAEGRPVVLGTGALRYGDEIRAALGDRLILPADEAVHQVSAAAVGRLALDRLRAGTGDDPRSLEPMYCRLSEAELADRRKRQGAGGEPQG